MILKIYKRKSKLIKIISFKVNMNFAFGSMMLHFLKMIIFFLSSNLLASSNTVKLEKAMATHSSTLAWKMPWMEEPCRLQSMGSLRVRHD